MLQALIIIQIVKPLKIFLQRFKINYILLSMDKQSLGRIVNAYLDLAEERANRKISAKIAQEFAESEWGKYRITQDKLFDSDFDKFAKEALGQSNKTDQEI